MPNGVDTSGSCNAPTGCTYAPLYFASDVLPDGRVVVIGGEDNPGTSGNMVETNIGFMYDPVANKWSSQLTEQFGTGNVGDAISVVLQDGTMVLGSSNSVGMESFDPSTLTFTLLNDTNKFDSSSQEGWTILPGVLGAAAPLNGLVLDVDSSASNAFEIYDPTANAWDSRGTTAGLTLADDGPAVQACSQGRERNTRTQVPVQEVEEGVRDLRAMGLRRDCHSRLTATTCAHGSISVCGGYHAISGEKIPVCAHAGTRCQVFASCLPGSPLWTAHDEASYDRANSRHQGVVKPQLLITCRQEDC